MNRHRHLQTMDINQGTPAETSSPPFYLLQFYQSRGQLPDESEMKISEMAAEDVQEHEKKEAADLLSCIRRRHKLWHP